MSKVGQLVGVTQNKWQGNWVLKQGAVWVDRDGGVHLIELLDCRYALNILRFIILQHTADVPRDPMASPLIAALVARARTECTGVLAAAALFALHDGLVAAEDLAVLA